MHHVGSAGKHTAPEEWHDYAAIITSQRLHISVHFSTFDLVEFGFSLAQILVGRGVVPMAFVPRVGVLKAKGEYHVRRCPPAAVNAEGLLEPDIRPLSVSLFSPRYAHAHYATKCRIRYRKGSRQSFGTGFFQMLACLNWIMSSLRQIGPVLQRIGDGLVIVDRCMTNCDLIDELLAVTGVFLGQPHIEVIKRRLAAEHG